jgi:signal peptidase I
MKKILHLLRMFVIVCLLSIAARLFIISPGRVDGQSMEPTYLDTEMFLVNKIALLLRAPRRGDIVQLIVPDDEHFVIKRVLGLPGEHIHTLNGEVTITKADGTVIKPKESYVKYDVHQGRFKKGTVEMKIPEGHYFVLGDNRGKSVDSRHYGLVPRSYILGVLTDPSAR